MNNNVENSPKNFVLLDTSYLIFYRYFALIKWWKFAKKDIELPENPYESTEFVEKFEKVFLECISNIKKKLKIHKETCKVIAACDCPRKEIWRHKFYSKYKENRDKDDKFMGGEFFRLVYHNDFLKKAGADKVFNLYSLEGDDVIAITKNIIRQKHKDAKIYIIANDNDYLQLVDDNTKIINLQFKSLSENNKVSSDPEKNLFTKIVLGDKSDCITSIFPSGTCGPKTVEKFYDDDEEFQKALKRYGATEKYQRNKKIISFKEIPFELQQTFIEKYEDAI